MNTKTLKRLLKHVSPILALYLDKVGEGSTEIIPGTTLIVNDYGYDNEVTCLTIYFKEADGCGELSWDFLEPLSAYFIALKSKTSWSIRATDSGKLALDIF